MNEQLSPAEEKAQEIRLNDEPDALAEFKAIHGIKEKFSVLLEYRTGAGTWAIINQFRNEYPSIETVGKQYGPGVYKMKWTFKEGIPGGGSRPIMKEYDFELSEIPWGETHDEYLAEKRRNHLERKRKDMERLKTDAEIHRIEAGPTAQAPGIEGIKSMVETLRTLGISVGGESAPQKNLLETVLQYLPLIQPFWKMMEDKAAAQAQMLAQQNDNNMKLILALVSRGQGGGPEVDMFKTLFGAGVDAMKQIVTLKQDMLPPPEESMVDKVFGVIDKVAPMVISWAAMKQEQRAADPMYSMAINRPEAKAIQKDPLKQAELVQRMDEQYGFQQANTMLEAFKGIVERPDSLKDNFKLYPSPGFDKEGKPLEKAA